MVKLVDWEGRILIGPNRKFAIYEFEKRTDNCRSINVHVEITQRILCQCRHRTSTSHRITGLKEIRNDMLPEWYALLTW